jgi:THO complex subunit 5
MAAQTIVKEPTLAAVLQISNHARDQVSILIDLISRLDSQHESSPESQSRISKQQRQLLTNISHLRGLHRAAYIAARDTKSQTAEARQEVDRLHLQLQNLYYEQRHLQGEIAACESYDHPYHQLPLMPEEDFVQLHPEHEASDEVALMFARIEHEKAEREVLEQQRQELLKRKAKLIADNKKRKQDLANLDKDLEKFIDAAKPIQKLFDKVV